MMMNAAKVGASCLGSRDMMLALLATLVALAVNAATGFREFEQCSAATMTACCGWSRFAT